MQRIIENAASDSSSSSFSIHQKYDTVNSSAYKSESYKILMTKNRPISVMEVINEDNTTTKVLPNMKKHFDEITMRSNSDNSSSMVSLPISPVLSIVDNISIPKDSLQVLEQSYNNRVNISECVSMKRFASLNSISDLITTRLSVNKDDEIRKMSIDSRRPTVSESFLDKVNRVNIREGSVSDTIGRRLGDLLLDSAKKMSTYIGIENMEVDASDSTLKMNKAKKRCSTPRKRKNLNTKFNQITEVVNEHVETYSCKSCQPTICVHECGDNVMFEEDISRPENNKKAKKKKDVIKVKILKPKKKCISKRISLIEPDLLYEDSGINNTKLEHLNTSNDSVEFIHNHSDTCIHINECMEDDSVKFVTMSASAISLNDVSTQSCHAWFGKQPENVPQDIVSTTNGVSALINGTYVIFFHCFMRFVIKLINSVILLKNSWLNEYFFAK